MGGLVPSLAHDNHLSAHNHETFLPVAVGDRQMASGKAPGNHRPWTVDTSDCGRVRRDGSRAQNWAIHGRDGQNLPGKGWRSYEARKQGRISFGSPRLL